MVYALNGTRHDSNECFIAAVCGYQIPTDFRDSTDGKQAFHSIWTGGRNEKEGGIGNAVASNIPRYNIGKGEGSVAH